MYQNTPVQFSLPETLKDWPWPRRINPFYEEVRREANEWLRGFHAFSEKGQAAFDACDFPLYGALAYYWYDKERLRLCVDALILSFVFDEYSDRSNVDRVREYAWMIMDAMRNPSMPRPQGECVLGEIARQFWSRGEPYMTSTAQRRLIESVQAYTDAVVERAKDRDVRHKRTVEEYLALRRRTIGGMPVFVMMQLEFNISDEVYYSPLVKDLQGWVIDMFILCNDMCSYNIEQARGDTVHNIIGILMHHHDITLHSALKYVELLHSELTDRVLTWHAQNSSLWENNHEVSQYVEGIINWVRANDSWHFETQRYFGQRGREIQQSRIVTLLPAPSSGALVTTPQQKKNESGEAFVSAKL